MGWKLASGRATLKRPGPLLTLLAGLLVGLFMLTLNATSGSKTVSSTKRETSPPVSVSTTPTPTPTSTATVTPSTTPSKKPVPNSNYAGRTDDDSASVAVSVRDGKAVAYFCDGRYKEAWLRAPSRTTAA